MACRDRTCAEAAGCSPDLPSPWSEDYVGLLSSRLDDNGHARAFHSRCDVQIHELDLASMTHNEQPERSLFCIFCLLLLELLSDPLLLFGFISQPIRDPLGAVTFMHSMQENHSVQIIRHLPFSLTGTHVRWLLTVLYTQDDDYPECFKSFFFTLFFASFLPVVLVLCSESIYYI